MQLGSERHRANNSQRPSIRRTSPDTPLEATISAHDCIRVIDCFSFVPDHELEAIELAALSGLDWLKLMQAVKRLCLLGYLEQTTGQSYCLSPRTSPGNGWERTLRLYRTKHK